MPSRKFTHEMEKEIAILYRRGAPQTELGSRFGCNPATISRMVRSLGIGRGKGNGRTPAMVWRHGATIRRWYESGLSLEEIERETGISSEAQKKILMALGIQVERRPRSRERHANWAGGRYVNDHGYVEVIDSDPRFASMRGSDGYTPEHRIVMARALGRPLKRHETVHHIDGNRQHNALSNLELHHGKHGNGVRFVCRECGSHNVEAVTLTAK